MYCIILLINNMRIAACQTPEILGDNDRAISCIESFSADVSNENVDLLFQCPLN